MPGHFTVLYHSKISYLLFLLEAKIFIIFIIFITYYW
jgi:hypothetical protein